MSLLPTYICPSCGELHNDWPALAFSSPLHYDELNDHDKENIATLDSDFCVIEDGETTDRFIRCTLFKRLMVIVKVCNMAYGYR